MDFNEKKNNNNKSYDKSLECEIQQCSENKEHLVDRTSWHSSCRLFIFERTHKERDITKEKQIS